MKKFCALAMGLILCLGMCGCSKGAGPQGISKEEYDRIGIGMEASKVRDIICDSDRCIEDMVSQKKVGDLAHYTYEYPGEKGGKATIVYESDPNSAIAPTVVVEKSQTGLK